MAYGIQIKSAGNELLIDENYLNPAFVGKVSLGTATSQTITESGWSCDKRAITYPGGGGYDMMIFWTIPESIDNNVTFAHNPRTFLTGSGLNDQLVVFRPTTGGSYNVPEGYVFRLGGFTASSETYGLRVYKSDGSLAFDSGLRHLQLKLLQANFQQSATTSTTSTTTISGTLPSKPAFLVNTFTREIWTGNTSSSSAAGTCTISGVRRSSNVITSIGRRFSSGVEDSYINGTLDFGQQFGDLPIINAALYD